MTNPRCIWCLLTQHPHCGRDSRRHNTPKYIFPISDIDDAANTGSTINANGSIADIIITEDGAISDLFEIIYDSSNIILRVKAGQTVGSDLGGGTPEHTLVINYDDGSGADNAISEDLIVTIDIV